MKILHDVIHIPFKKLIFVSIAASFICISSSTYGSLVERIKTKFYAYLAARAKRGGLDLAHQLLDPRITSFNIIQTRHNADLKEFFTILNAIGNNETIPVPVSRTSRGQTTSIATGWMQSVRSYLQPSSTKQQKQGPGKNYFELFDHNTQEQYIAACQRAFFEVDWNINISMRLTETALDAYISHKNFSDFVKKSQWPKAYIGLAQLAQQFQQQYQDRQNPYYFPRSVPYLSRDIYQDPSLTKTFNAHTSIQLLDWVQKKINAIFALEITDVGMKYVLLHLVNRSTTDQEALQELYRLAFLYDYSLRQGERETGEEPSIIQHEYGKNLGVVALKKLVGTFDWIRGRLTIFWQSRWAKEGIIKKPLPLPDSSKLYAQLQKNFPLQSSLIPQKKASPTTIPFIPEETMYDSLDQLIRQLQELAEKSELYVEKGFKKEVENIVPGITQDENISLSKEQKNQLREWLAKQTPIHDEIEEIAKSYFKQLNSIIKKFNIILNETQEAKLKEIDTTLSTNIAEIDEVIDYLYKKIA